MLEDTDIMPEQLAELQNIFMHIQKLQIAHKNRVC